MRLVMVLFLPQDTRMGVYSGDTEFDVVVDIEPVCHVVFVYARSHSQTGVCSCFRRVQQLAI